MEKNYFIPIWFYIVCQGNGLSGKSLGLGASQSIRSNVRPSLIANSSLGPSLQAKAQAIVCQGGRQGGRGREKKKKHKIG